jgi:predicted nucleic acid-binding protein
MNYILDTNVISELVKTTPNENLINWISLIDQNSLYISAISIGEIKSGIIKLKYSNAKKAIKLDSWVNELLQVYTKRILEIDLDTCLTWGELMSITKNHPIDALIAAQAINLNYCVATRNIPDFEQFRCRLINPFEK